MAYDMKPTMDQLLTSTAAITPHVAVNRSLSDYRWALNSDGKSTLDPGSVTGEAWHYDVGQPFSLCAMSALDGDDVETLLPELTAGPGRLGCGAATGPSDSKRGADPRLLGPCR